MKEVKRNIINGRMKGKGNNKGIKKYKCGVQKEQMCFFLSAAHVNKVPGRKRFLVVVVNKGTADGP
jgi:hypothetical protein